MLTDPVLADMARNAEIARAIRGRSAEAATHYVLFWRKSPDDAKGRIAELDQAVSIDPSWPEPRIFRGICRRDIGDEDGALADFRAAVDLDPSDENLLELALEYRHVGDAVSALFWLDRTIQVSPDDLQARWHRAEVREETGDIAGAIEEFTWIADQHMYSDKKARARAASLRAKLDAK